MIIRIYNYNYSISHTPYVSIYDNPIEIQVKSVISGTYFPKKHLLWPIRKSLLYTMKSIFLKNIEVILMII